MTLKMRAWIISAGVLAVGALAQGHFAQVSAAGPFDGSYRGTVKLVRATVSSQGMANCGSVTAAGSPSTRRVADNKLTINYGGSDITFDVGADGTISGTSTYGRNELTATGKITGTSLVMDYGTRHCAFRFEGNR